MGYNYFYENSSDKFTFYRIPKVFFTDPEFRKLSTDAKLLYGLMLDRMSLSRKNGWYDESGRAYIYYSIESIQEDLDVSNKTAVKFLNQLKERGLIKTIRQGLSKTNIIYVMDFSSPVSSPVSSPLPEPEFTHSEKKNPENITGQEEKPNYEIQTALVKQNISYEALCLKYSSPMQKRIIDGVVSTITDILCFPRKTVVINQAEMPYDIVRGKLEQVEYDHVEYVLDSILKNPTDVKNIKSYLLTALYNSIDTIDLYYGTKS